MSTNKLPTRFAVKFFVLQVAQVKKAKDSCYRRATYKGKYKEAVESARAGLSPKKGDVRKKRKRKKNTKEGGLSPQEGDVRKKKRKKTKEGKKVAPAKARFHVPSTKNFFFWFTSIWVWNGPSCLKYRLLRDLVYEEAMCKGSSGNRLLYTAKAVP